jgi:hypothetical protein
MRRHTEEERERVFREGGEHGVVDALWKQAQNEDQTVNMCEPTHHPCRVASNGHG